MEIITAFSNAVIKCQGKGGKQIDFYMLFDHTFCDEDDLLAQILTYTNKMFQSDKDAEKPLRLICPFIYYQGGENWALRRDLMARFTSYYLMLSCIHTGSFWPPG